MALMQQWRFDVVLLSADIARKHRPIALHELERVAHAPTALMSQTPHEIGPLAADMLRRIESVANISEEPVNVSVGSLTMDPQRGTATVEGAPLKLTTYQFELLYLLSLNLGQFVHRGAIAQALSSPVIANGRSADVHVYRIRRKLKELGVTSLRLETVHGRGYCLSLKAAGHLVGPPAPHPHERWYAAHAPGVSRMVN